MPTTVLLMAAVVAGVLLTAIVLASRRVRVAARGDRADGAATTGWLPTVMSNGPGGDCSGADAGCDGGGGGGD